MNKIYLLLCFLFFPNLLFAQKLTFNYDASGNQSERRWICINCRPAPTMASETPVKKQTTEESGEMLTEKLLKVYPNPITEVLMVSWRLPNKNSVQQIQVFTMGGIQMFNSKYSPNQNETQIAFGKMPPGTYILLIKYTDGSSESIKLIKI